MTPTPNPTAEPLKSWEVNNEAWEAFSAEEHLTNGIQAAYEAGLRAQNRLSEGAPSEAQVEAAAEAIHNLMQGDPSFKDSGRKREMRIYARAALVAAQGAARPVNGFDTTAERVKTGDDSLHVAPQAPNQNETKSGNNFVSLDPEKVQDHLYFALRDAGYGRATSELLASVGISALCEAYTGGKLHA